MRHPPVQDKPADPLPHWPFPTLSETQLRAHRAQQKALPPDGDQKDEIDVWNAHSSDFGGL